MPAQEMDELNLHRFAVTEWLGYIWVNLDEKASALADQVNPQLLTRFGDLGVLSRYGTEDLQVTTTITYEVQANWKLILENFSECYHCPSLHPELTAALPFFRSGYGTVSGPVGQGAQLADVMEGFSLSGRATAPRLPGLTPEDARTFHGVVLRPNVALALVPDHVAFYRLHPQSPGHTRVIVDWLFHPEASSLPAFDPSDAVELLDRANRQDFEACERCQLGAPSKYFTSTLVPHEYVIAELRDWFETALTPANGQARGGTRSSADVSLVHPVS
jgi:Rieske 2Fe-2S family protein